MAGTFKFELVTPERMALSEDVGQVVVPGVEGDFTVLPGHAPVISALRPGIIDVTLPDARAVYAEVVVTAVELRRRGKTHMEVCEELTRLGS